MMLLAALPVAAQAQPIDNPEIEVGVVQRFGEEADATLTLEPFDGDQLTLTFKTGGQPQTVETDQVVIETVMAPLSEPELSERVVLSTHRSFESAEDSAQQWRNRGIEAEIAQPDTWEVWAHRDTYSTPLLRRLLLQNLHEQGYTDAFLDSRVLAEVPKASFIADGFRYHRDRVEITSGNRRIRVIRSGNTAEARLYGGDLRLQPNAYGTYTLVNDVPIETYLRGVVPHEIGLGAPQSTIEAQAILARTYALRNLRRFATDDYELCANTHCQVYWGLGGAAAKSDQAISATQGLVLTYEDELVDALYSSTTGGVTAAFSDVWNGPDRPYLRSVVDSVQGSWDLEQLPLNIEANFRRFISLERGFNEEDWVHFRWAEAGSLEDMTQSLRSYLRDRRHSLQNLSQITAIRVTARALSGRVQTLAVDTDLGTLELDKDEVLRVFDVPRSLLFYVEPMYDLPQNAANQGASEAEAAPEPVLKGFRFIGGGWGHGVGMSQTGAYHLGALGWSSQNIVEFYYPGAEVKPLSESLTLWRPSQPPTTATP